MNEWINQTINPNVDVTSAQINIMKQAESNMKTKYITEILFFYIDKFVVT